MSVSLVFERNVLYITVEPEDIDGLPECIIVDLARLEHGEAVKIVCSSSNRGDSTNCDISGDPMMLLRLLGCMSHPGKELGRDVLGC